MKQSSPPQPSRMDIVRNYLGLSREFQQQQLYQKAEETLKLALEKVPNHPFLLSGLANLYVKMGDFENALKILNQIIRHHPKLTFPHFLRGKIYESRYQLKRAIQEYERALQGNKKDVYILFRLIPLLIKRKQAREALELIQKYQNILQDSTFMTEWEAEALVLLNDKAHAFNRMREALLKKPGDHYLVRRYLQMSIQASKKSPLEVYELLKISVPKLAKLDEQDLTDLEIEYLIHHKKYEQAMEKIDQVLAKEKQNYYWRKRKAFLLRDLGEEDQALEIMKELFLENPGDVYIRNYLEKYYLENRQANEWKKLLKKALDRHPQHGELFGYIRRANLKQDWLGMCNLEYDDFLNQVRALSLAQHNIYDITYAKLPLYVIETFVSQLNLTDQVPEPEKLWDVILKEHNRPVETQPPFQLEDLEVCYPVWLFSLQFYFLFKSFSDFAVSFIPALFQKETIAAVVEKNKQVVYIGLELLLNPHPRRIKSLIKYNKGFRWRWPRMPQPEIDIHGIHFYEKQQFLTVLEKMEQALAS